MEMDGESKAHIKWSKLWTKFLIEQKKLEYKKHWNKAKFVKKCPNCFKKAFAREGQNMAKQFLLPPLGDASHERKPVTREDEQTDH